jgi:hypothetical protein
MIPSMRPEPKRDDDGAYRLPDPRDGREKSWKRATTLAHALDIDTFHLDRWSDRTLLEGIKAHPELLDRVQPAVTRADKDRQAELAKEARRLAGAEEGADAGTDMHTVTEYADAGRIGEISHLVSPEQLADLLAYQEALCAAGITVLPEYIERIVVNTQTGTGGTLDRVVRLPDGRLVIADVKTQKTVSFGWLSICIQLAEYANADAMLGLDGSTLELLPAELDRTTGLVMHLPVGKAECKLYQLDLAAGWEAALLAVQVTDMNKRSKALGRPYRSPDELPEKVANDQLLYLVRNAGHPAALEALWRHAGDRWQAHHTEAAKRRRAELEAVS